MQHSKSLSLNFYGRAHDCGHGRAHGRGHGRAHGRDVVPQFQECKHNQYLLTIQKAQQL